ncbi:unnamed protein product [Arctia plantaginis]|uniref:Insulin-like growth factor-binding protein complex acid labile subunit n=1 Tax=Arctia plantaginis TaxID=874455 RepID=A0A8S1A1Z3_ARCPL|nr:unnamed protein product [Arctia plantaginis]
MVRLLTAICFLFATKVAIGEIADFEQDLNDLCYVCTCSIDKTNINCSGRGLSELPNGSSSQVRNLNISNNDFSVFPEKLYTFANLVTLDISANRLSELPGNALQNLTALELLNLSKNNFESWLSLNPNNAFKLATNLKILDLSHNRFRTMGNLANQELLTSGSIETLILEHCEIISIHGRSPLAGLTNIKELKLNFNPLLRIKSLMSATLRSLEVSNCALSTINHNEFMFLPSLIRLIMSHNYRLELSSSAYHLFSDSLKYLDISFCNIMQPNLQGFPNLRKAILNHNMIRFLRSNEFLNNTRLEYLDISYNNIGSLRSDTFRGLSLIKHLDLSWNELANIPEDTLLEMPSLTQLKLARNFLTSVGHLRSLSLTVLDLSFCEISNIGKGSLEGLQSLIDLDLSRNLLSHIPDSLSSNTLKYLNLNYNRISFINNYTFFMLPRLVGLSVIGNRFTTIWKRSFFESNRYLERLDLADNMWRCDCADPNMVDFFEFVTLEPNKKEESYNLVCNSPMNLFGQSWLQACYFVWNPTEKAANPDGLILFIIIMIAGLAICLLLVSCVKRSMKRRLLAIQAERERQVEEARDRLRQLRIQAEQEALISTPDPRDLIPPPSYDDALSMPKLSSSSRSLNESGTGKTKRRRGRRKTKSSGDLLEETERNGDLPVLDDVELAETSDGNRQRRRRELNRYGSHEVAELEQSPGARRRQLSGYNANYSPQMNGSVTVQVEAQLERPVHNNTRRHSIDDNELRESDL